MIRQCCDSLDVRILKGVVSKDHVHLHLSYPPKLSVSDLVKRTKGRSARLLLDEFSELKKQMGTERVSKIETKTKAMLAEMLLPEIRKHSGLTQKEVANVLGISQPGLSKIEHQEDMQIGTLSKLIKAMGGSLEIIAHLPQGDCRLTQFGD